MDFVLNVAASEVTADTLGAKVVIFVVVGSLFFATLWLGPNLRGPIDSGQKIQAARDLRLALARRWDGDPVWQSVNEGGRLPIQWRPADLQLFPANSSSLIDAGLHSSPVERLAGMWLDGGPSRILVLLGQAGSGKTELLVGVFRNLLSSWEDGRLVPVLIPVAGWNPNEQRLRSWLIGWLRANHRFLGARLPGDVVQTLAEAMFDDGALAIILDGFDEITPQYRARAVRELNDLDARQYVLLSSRFDEYESAIQPVHDPRNLLRRAEGVVIEDQEQVTVIDYLNRRASSAGNRWDVVGQSLSKRPDLARVLHTPLMIMLADAIYNGPQRGQTSSLSDPDEMLSISGVEALTSHLLDGFIPARYPIDSTKINKWTSDDARHWLGYLARMLGASTDLRWWDLHVTSSRKLRPAAVHTMTSLVVVAWTALSAGVLSGWVFDSTQTGVTDAVRISAAALICYFAMLYLTDSTGAAVIGVVGAYIAGSLAGSYDLAIGVGLVAGFSWRPLTTKRASLCHAVVIGCLVASVSAAIRGIGILLPIPLEVDLTKGFAAGAADGLVSRWDGDVNGWLASGIVATIVAWTGLKVTAGHIAASNQHAYRISPLISGITAGTVIVGIDTWADSFQSDVVHSWMAAPADGLAVGLAVWWVSHWAERWSPKRAGRQIRWAGRWTAWPIIAGVLMAILTTGANVVTYSTRTDIQHGWSSAIAEGIGVGILIWFALDHRERNDAQVRRNRRMSFANRARLTIPALAVGAAVGLLDAISAGPASGASTGIGLGLVVLFLSYRRGSRSLSTDCHGQWEVNPLEAGIFATALVGLVAGFGYGLMYGLVAGLACRVSRDISRRQQPTGRVLPSLRGAAGGALLGGIITLAAAGEGIPGLWLVIIGITSGVAAAFAFGVQGETTTINVMQLAPSPRSLFVQDRTAFLIITALIAGPIGIAIGARTLAAGRPLQIGILAALSTLLTYGLTAALVIASSATRYGTFNVARARLAARGDLPWRLMPFLDDAHSNRLALRSVGASYRFRHLFLQERMAATRHLNTDPSVPEPRQNSGALHSQENHKSSDADV